MTLTSWIFPGGPEGARNGMHSTSARFPFFGFRKFVVTLVLITFVWFRFSNGCYATAPIDLIMDDAPELRRVYGVGIVTAAWFEGTLSTPFASTLSTV